MKVNTLNHEYISFVKANKFMIEVIFRKIIIVLSFCAKTNSSNMHQIVKKGQDREFGPRFQLSRASIIKLLMFITSTR